MDSNWSLQKLVIEQPGTMNRMPVSTPLSRQGSMYSWKDCGPVNMNELVSEGLQREGSLTLAQNTVDEVWKYIKEKEEHAKINNRGGGGGGRNIPLIQRQQPLGDINLEAKGIYNNNAGYIHGSSSLISTNPNTRFYDIKENVVPSRSQVQQLNGFNLHSNAKESVLRYPQQQPKPHGYGYGTQTGFSSGQVNSHGMRDKSLEEKNINLVPSVGNSSSVKGRKNRNGMGMENKRIEKTQRRKIKNRESAARSRARKHAQIMELEAEVEKLKEENQELLRKEEVINLQERPERQLRRTQSDIK